MTPTRRVVVLTNGNYFAYKILRPLLEDSSFDVVRVIVVTGGYRGERRFSAAGNLLAASGWHYAAFKLSQSLLFASLDLLPLGPSYQVGSAAARLGIPLSKASDVNSPTIVAMVRQAQPDLLLSVSCPQRIKDELLRVPSTQSVNIHASLLPRDAGLAPYFWVLAGGRSETGISIHALTERFDEGRIFAQARVPIQPRESAFSLFSRLSDIGGDLLPSALERVLGGDPGTSQDSSFRTYNSHPTPIAYRALRTNGHRLIRTRDLLVELRRRDQERP